MEDVKQNKNKLEFSIVYSYFLKEFISRFYTQLNILITGSILIVTLCLISGLTTIFFKSFLLILLFVNFLLEPNVKSYKAINLAKEYLNLCNKDLDTKQEFEKLQARDSIEINCFTYPAYIATLNFLGYTTDELRKFTLLEKLSMIFIIERLRVKILVVLSIVKG